MMNVGVDKVGFRFRKINCRVERSFLSISQPSLTHDREILFLFLPDG